MQSLLGRGQDERPEQGSHGLNNPNWQEHMESSGSGPHKETITLVAPAGQTEEVAYHPNEKVGEVLKKAVTDFGRAGFLNPDLQYVLVMNATPLDPSLSLAAAGVKPGARLSVRAKAVPGDGHASRS